MYATRLNKYIPISTDFYFDEIDREYNIVGTKSYIDENNIRE